MAFMILRRVFLLRSTTNSLLLSQRGRFSTSRASTFVDHDRAPSVTERLHLSPLFQETGEDGMKQCRIELVDDSTWNVSSGLADAWKRGNSEVASLRMRSSFSDRECDGGENDGTNNDGGVFGSASANKDDPDFDEIEDMRIRGNLFYKLDRGSKEYEEYKFDFHGSKSARNERDRRGSNEGGKKENSNRALASTAEMASKKGSTRDMKVAEEKDCMTREIKKSEERKRVSLLGREMMSKNSNSWLHEVRDASIGKKQRTPTFNQLTDPYHEPFCLDVYISKGSVRASIIHRATSNVVVVAHSISKDMKFDLGSTKNKSTCAAVGRILAERALADDIHNIVYTPRKGEKLEGKLQIVVKSIIDGGVDVKVKLKQTRLKQNTFCQKLKTYIDYDGYGDVNRLGFSIIFLVVLVFHLILHVSMSHK
ncbi:hypothetical protein C2S51_013870 [Perilla frutescens var. frutescens]|nr:hypothetical protein C2S51_013870 [Perilla frutescens var. frutescens]